MVSQVHSGVSRRRLSVQYVEADCPDVDVPEVVKYSHFLRIIIRNGEITSMVYFYDYGGTEYSTSEPMSSYN